MNCLLIISAHNYYAQPIYYTYVSKCCESLIDWGILLNIRTFHITTQQKNVIIPLNVLYYNMWELNPNTFGIIRWRDQLWDK